MQNNKMNFKKVKITNNNNNNNNNSSSRGRRKKLTSKDEPKKGCALERNISTRRKEGLPVRLVFG
jgi:hypothetical protein